MFDSPTFSRMFASETLNQQSHNRAMFESNSSSTTFNREHLSNDALSGTEKFADLLSWQIVHTAEIEQTYRRAMTPDYASTSRQSNFAQILHRSFSESNLFDSFDIRDTTAVNTKHSKQTQQTSHIFNRNRILTFIYFLPL